MALVLLFDDDLLVGEEHEVEDQDFGGLLEGLLGSNTTVGENLHREFLIVRTLLDTVLVDSDADVADRGIDRVYSERTDRIVSLAVVVSGYVSATLIDGQF